jgi:signal transduction histidine kinase
MISHDLRSPLTSMQGVLILLENGAIGQINDQGKQIAVRAYKECSRMLRLLDDILEISKIKAGVFNLQCAELSIGQVIREAVENVTHIANEKQIRIEQDAPPAVAYGDDQRIMQVLLNLLSNAIKYAPASSSIRIAANDVGEEILVSVMDQGKGIPSDKLDKIFGKFEQAELADQREMGGTGLGLAICKAIVQEHGGRIGVESKVGEGSRFWFTIPKHPAGVPLQTVTPGS